MIFDYSVALVFPQGAEVNVDLEAFVSQLRRAGIGYDQAVHDFRKQFILTLLLRHRGINAPWRSSLACTGTR